MTPIETMVQIVKNGDGEWLILCAMCLIVMILLSHSDGGA